MMDFIFVPLVVGVVTLGIYKFFELLVCRRERRMIIDKMDGNALIDYLKFVPMGVRIGAPVSVRPVLRTKCAASSTAGRFSASAVSD